MRRAGLAAAAAIMAMATLTACGGSDEDFCNVGKDVEAADFEPGSDEAKDLMDEAVDNAPDDIKGDVEAVRDAMEDPEAADPEEMSKASENVTNWVSENCEE